MSRGRRWVGVAAGAVALLLCSACATDRSHHDAGTGATASATTTAAASDGAVSPGAGPPGSSDAAGSGTSGGVPAVGTGSAGCGRAPAYPVGTTTTGTITSGGHARTFLVHLPAGYSGDRPTPVVLAFHGRKGTGNDVEGYSGIDGLDAIAVYPRGLPATTDGETAWEGAPGAAPVDDVRFVTDLLDHLGATACVDTGRVFATGKSEGGGFTALLACRIPDRIAAFATVSGAFYPGTGCSGGRPVPLVDFHGTGDKIMKYEGGTSHRERYPSIPDWLAGWAARDHCAGSTSTPIGSDVTHLTWSGCAAGSALEHYRITGGGHTWPGATGDSGPGKVTHTISATQMMWTFFQAHARK